MKAARPSRNRGRRAGVIPGRVIAAVLTGFLVALLAPLLEKGLGRRAAPLLALFPAGLFAGFVLSVPEVAEGGTRTAAINGAYVGRVATDGSAPTSQPAATIGGATWQSAGGTVFSVRAR